MTPPTRTSPTARDKEALRVIRRYLRAYGQAPTRIELGRELGISGPSAHQHVIALERCGLVWLDRRAHRGVGVV